MIYDFTQNEVFEPDLDHYTKYSEIVDAWIVLDMFELSSKQTFWKISGSCESNNREKLRDFGIFD